MRKMTAAANLDAYVAALDGWQLAIVKKLRAAVRRAKPADEAIKWGNLVYFANGPVAVIRAEEARVLFGFWRGKRMIDLEPKLKPGGKYEMATLEIGEGDQVSPAKATRLMKAAIALNKTIGDPTKAAKSKKKKPKLLSGGNPQIAKGYGEALVKAYLKAIPGWKKAVARRIDALITAAVPGVHKAVKWNSPFYGFEGKGWFLVFHIYARYIKVGFFRGSSLKPMPPAESKHPKMRYCNIHENELDEAQFTAWVKQASKLPGGRM